MKKIKIVISIAISLMFSGANALDLSDEDYLKIENTFLKYSISKGENVTKINVDDFRYITVEEKNNILIIQKGKPELNELLNKVLSNSWSNNKIIYNFNGNNTVLLYPNKLKPNNFKKNACNYVSLISDVNSCLNTYIDVKKNLATVFNSNKIYLDDSYLADFLYIHELSHLLPAQRKLPEFDYTNVWLDDITRHYGEIYSDLFAVIFLNNYMGYDEESIEDLIKLRKFKLFANQDLIHYSVPYIEKMRTNDKWKSLKSFEDIDLLIRDVYIDVNTNNIISKKKYKNVYYEYYNFCNSLNMKSAKSGNIFDFMKKYCIESK